MLLIPIHSTSVPRPGTGPREYPCSIPEEGVRPGTREAGKALQVAERHGRLPVVATDGEVPVVEACLPAELLEPSVST